MISLVPIINSQNPISCRMARKNTVDNYQTETKQDQFFSFFSAMPHNRLLTKSCVKSLSG